MKMARILYLVAGEGNGHATRSAAVIEELKSRGHQVIAVSDGNALQILKPVSDSVIEAVTPHMAYRKNQVSALGTLWKVMCSIPRFIMDTLKVRRVVKDWNPQVIVTDFNPMSRFIRGIPIISIDNQAIITKGDMDMPKGWFVEYLKSKSVVLAVMPSANPIVITTFFNVAVLLDAVRIGPIISRKVRSLKPKNGQHLLVYQTSPTNEELADLLPLLDIEIRAYGFARRGTIKKVKFMPFDQEQWYTDLASAKAVVVNGGFSLITESLFLKKPVLCFPIGHQFEQALNAHYLQKEGLGLWAKETSEKEFGSFLKKVPSIKKRLESKTWPDGARQAADIIEQAIGLKRM